MSESDQNQEQGTKVGTGSRWNLLRMFRGHKRPADLQSAESEFHAEAQNSLELAQQWDKTFQVPQSRKQAYDIYRRMDHGVIGAMLDLYSEECTQPDPERDQTMWIEAENSKVKEEGEKCLRNLMTEDTAAPIARDLAKLGDHFRRLIYESGQGVLGWQYAPPEDVTRIDDKYGRLTGFQQQGEAFRGHLQRKESWPWDYVHFRLQGKNASSGYGTALIDPMYRSWRMAKLCMAEGTIVWTDRGSTEVEKLNLSDKVYCHEPFEAKTYKTSVSAIANMGYKECVRVKTKDRQIDVTKDHRLLVKTVGGSFVYKEAKDLDGDMLVLPYLSSEEPVEYQNVTQVEEIGERNTYHLEVEDDLHNFVAEGVVSHNSEDSVLMYRLRRTPDRNLIMLDVGDMEEGEAEKYANIYRKRLRKQEYVDPSSSEYAKQYNPFQPFEDLVLPMRKDDNTRVQKMSGSGQADRIYDLEYYMRKLFTISRIPRSYMGFENESTNKNSLLQLDVRFARTIKRLRKALIYGYRTALDIHFALLSPENNPDKWWPYKKENQYIVQMTPISYLDEYEHVQLVKLRFELIQSLSRLTRELQLDPQTWATYILLNYAKLPEHIVTKLTANTGEESDGPFASHDPFASFEKYARVQQLDEAEKQEWRNDPESIKAVFSSMGTRGREGFYELRESEKQQVAEAISSSAGLRRTIGQIAEDEHEHVALGQIDPSLLPPAYANVGDTVQEDQSRKQLNEDLRMFQGGQSG